MSILVTEVEFRTKFHLNCENLCAYLSDIGSVTGPGRSGAVAAVYASHYLKIPFIPYGSRCPVNLGRLLIIDTAEKSGRTMRKAERKYAYADPLAWAVYSEPPRVRFWYEEQGEPYVT